jgi:hypothetical protein
LRHCDERLDGTRRSVDAEGEDKAEAGVNEAAMQARLDLLRTEHRDLDAAIAALATTTTPDQIQLARLKKRKLRLRDEIAQVEDQLIPDIIA